jgi:hypothetical protein
MEISWDFMTNLLERAIKLVVTVTATGDVLRIGKFGGDVCGESKSGMRDSSAKLGLSSSAGP